MFRLAQRPYPRGVSPCRRPSTRLLSSAKIHLGQPFEEETFPWYAADQFYPVRVGEVLDSRYKVLGKLGYGAHSTSWLCRNIRYGRRASYLCCFMFKLMQVKRCRVCHYKSLHPRQCPLRTYSSGTTVLRARRFARFETPWPIFHSWFVWNIRNRRSEWPTPVSSSSPDAHDHPRAPVQQSLASIA
jgi:hypothetical protein